MALEKALAALLDGADDVPLWRLPRHGILLWLVATANWKDAVPAGPLTEEWRHWQEHPAAGAARAD
jgi:hypothetical protein